MDENFEKPFIIKIPVFLYIAHIQELHECHRYPGLNSKKALLKAH